MTKVNMIKKMKINMMAVIDRFVRAAVDLPAGTIVLRFKTSLVTANQSIIITQ